jgi:DeoR/GlpR family transcriptional regulator of sugar metabolism
MSEHVECSNARKLCNLADVKATERLAALAGLLQRDGRVEITAAADAFGAAEMTIRRDLDRMVAMGMARRVRGGAISLLMRGAELPFAMRELERIDAKRRIAAEVAAQLRDGEAVLLDSGTTAVQIGRVIAGRRLTVMPMSLHAADALSASDSVRLLMPGGEIRLGELAMVGPLALASIGALRFDTAVLTCCGLAGGQVTAHDLDDAEVKQAMLRSAARVLLATDSSKFRCSALALVCDATAADLVVTDSAAPGDALDALRAAGVEVRCV